MGLLNTLKTLHWEFSIWFNFQPILTALYNFGECSSLTPCFALLAHYEEGYDTKHVIAIVYIQHWFRSSLFINILCSVFQVERPKIYNKIFSKSKIWYWPNLAYMHICKKQNWYALIWAIRLLILALQDKNYEKVSIINKIITHLYLLFVFQLCFNIFRLYLFLI